MRTAADVRERPMKGDAVIYGPQHQSERVDVIEIPDGFVLGIVNSRHRALYSNRQWREWMANAEVLHIAQPAPGGGE